MRTNMVAVGLIWVVAACGGGDAGGTADHAAAGGQAAGAPPAAQAAAPAEGDAAAAGETVYSNVCVVCHQANGKGMEGAFPPLAGSKVATGTPETAIKIVLRGLSGTMTRGGMTYNGVMTPWAAQLSDQDIANVLTYVRSSWGNNAPAVTAEQVATVRAAVESHPDMFTTKELGIEN